MHQALPANPSIWALSRLLDQATRWLDHCDNEIDCGETQEFILELEIKINELSEKCDFLNRCLKSPQ